MMFPRSIIVFLLASVSTLYLVFFCLTEAIAQTDVDEPFGLLTEVAPEPLLSANWQELLPQLNNDLSIIDQCRAEPWSCSSSAALKFLGIVEEGGQYTGRVQIGRINRAVNYSLRLLKGGYVDAKWSSPLVALGKGAGDCKHYAILKYAALREVGFAQDAIRIIIVEVRSTHQQHALVAVRIDAHWLLLDTHTLALVESSEALDYYLPLYALNEQGIQQFARSGQIVESLKNTRTPMFARINR